MVFFLSALRAVVELIGLCLIGQAVLYAVAGERRRQNAIYRLFDLVTQPPRALVRRVLPARASHGTVAVLTFVSLFMTWILLAWLRKNI